MDDKNSSSEALWSRLLRGEEKQDQVDQLLAQFHEENALQLNLHSHTLKTPLNFSSKSDPYAFDCAGLDHILSMRYANLKAPSPKPQSKETTHLNKDSSGNGDPAKDSDNSAGKISGVGENSRVLVDEEEERILGRNLAARLAALKTPSSSASAEVSGVRGLDSQGTQLGFQGEETCSEEERVQRLLASVQDSLRLDKSGVRVSDEEEEVSDSEVDKVVEWAKDAARLEPDDEEDDDEGVGGESDEDESRGRRRNERK